MGNHRSSLPYFEPLLIALSRTSSPCSIHLSVYLQFQSIPISAQDDWSDVASLDGLSVFWHPIELHIGPSLIFASIGCLFEQNSDIQRLLQDRKLTIIKEWYFEWGDKVQNEYGSRGFVTSGHPSTSSTYTTVIVLPNILTIWHKDGPRRTRIGVDSGGYAFRHGL